MSEITTASLLIVVGEPFSAEHKELILERVSKGLQCWDVESTGVDINEELANIASAAPPGEDGANDEKSIELSSDKLRTEILINPQIQTLLNKLRQFVLSGSRHYHLVYAGHAFQGSGDWILQDDCMSLAKLSTLLKEADVENHIKQNEGATLTLATFSDGDWNDASIAKTSFGKILKVKVNPEVKLDLTSGVEQFLEYLSAQVKPRPVKELLQSSDVVGNIRFSRPTLYIFPGSQGDSALFGISGFNLLVNGGYNRKACFWDFTRHLDRIDAMLYTHLGADNLFGLSSVLERKAHENVHPEIGYIYMNVVDKAKHSPNGDTQPENGAAHKSASLVVNLIEEGDKMVENLRHVGQVPHPCLGSVAAQNITPINLYHKVGHGTLDMFVLNPFTDSKDLKEFFSQWNKHVSNFSAKGGIPVPHACSVCALLVWRPASPAEKITRILFPGSAPQQKVFEGLDKLKTVDIFQHPICSEKSLATPKAGVKKPGSGIAKPSAGKAAAATKVTPTARAEVKKAAPATKTAPPKTTAAPKGAKEATNNKKAAAARSSPASSRASSKAGSKASTPKSTTPAETPKDIASPAAEPVNGLVGLKQSPPEPEPVVPEPEPVVKVAEPVVELAAAEPLKSEAPKEEPLIDVAPPGGVTTLEEPKEPEVEATTPEMPTPPPGDPMTMSFIDMDTMGSHPTESAPEGAVPEGSAPEGQEPVPEESLIKPAVVDETAAMPEVDQVPASPEKELATPEALPDPVVSDPMTASFMDGLGDNPVMDSKALEDAGIFDNEAQQPEVHVQEEVSSTAAADVAAAPAPVEEPLLAEPEAQVSLESTPDVALTQEADPVPDVVADVTDQKKQMEDLGIFDDEVKAAADNTKKMEDLGIFDDDAAQPEAAKTEQRNDLEDMGIFDEEVKAAADNTKQLEDLGIFDADSADKVKGEIDAGLSDPVSLPDPVLDLEEVRTPRTPDPQEPSPDADHAPFNGESPQNLPEPEEPEPAMLDSDLPKVHMELQKAREEVEDLLPEGETSEPTPEGEPTPDVEPTLQGETVEDVLPEGEPTRKGETQVAPTPEGETGREITPSPEDDTINQEETVRSEPSPAVEETESVEHPDEPVIAPASQEPSHHQVEPAANEAEDAVRATVETDDVMLSEDDAVAEECDGSDVSGGLTADDLAQCPEPEVPLDIPGVEQDQGALHDSLMQAQSPEDQPPRSPGDQPLRSPEDKPDPEDQPDPAAGHNIPFDVHDASFSGSDHSNPFPGLEGAATSKPPAQLADIPAAQYANGLSSDQYEPVDRDSLERDVMERDSIEKEAAVTDPAKLEVTDPVKVKDTDEKDQGAEFDPLKSWGEPMQLPPPGAPTRRSLPASTSKKPATPKKDPLKGWESPQGLPAPPPPSDADKKTSTARRSVGPAAKKAADPKKAAPTKTAAAKKTPGATTATSTARKTTAAAKPPNGVAKKDDKASTKNGPSAAPAAKKASSAAPAKKATGRPSTAPEKAAPKAASAKRPGTTTAAAAASRASPAPVKATPVVPFYVDLTYVPCHGDMHYMDWDFFRRVRARYYVISALSPSPSTLTALLEAKQTWDNPDLEVTIIPTFDNDSIRHWMALHREQLAQLKIDVAPSANRCTIQLQDHETSCAAFRLEF